MKISYSAYSLKPVNSLNAVSEEGERPGVLLKVEWPDGRTGYSDLHPWPELGDLTLDEHLALLRTGKLSVLVEQAIWLAVRDAELRKEKKNVFDLYPKVRNNFVVTNPSELKEGDLEKIKADGFNCLKVKVGRNLAEESDFLARATHEDFTLRLDMNGVGSWQIFEKFITRLDAKTLAFVEYVEDPFPYDLNAWIEANSLVKIALDNQFDRVDWDTEKWLALRDKPFDVIVLKPAKQDADRVVQLCRDRELQCTVTSYMGHAVGMMHALALAMELKKTYNSTMLDAGCMTHRLYHMDSFSSLISTQGPFVAKVPGLGIGFDELLESQPWSQIKLR